VQRSVLPPAAKGTIIVIDLLGYGWADAPIVPPKLMTIESTARRRVFIDFLPMSESLKFLLLVWSVNPLVLNPAIYPTP
jgi:hypothetical protein